MTRELTSAERDALLPTLNPDMAEVLKCDKSQLADRWWAHAQTVMPKQAEDALAAKLGRIAKDAARAKSL